MGKRMETNLETERKRNAPLSVEMETRWKRGMETKAPFLVGLVSIVLSQEIAPHRRETHRTFGTHRPRTRARE